MTGRTNVYNANVSQVISSFDDDIGFIAGLPVDTQTIAHAFKKYGASIGTNYTTYYDGKWGIGVSSLFVQLLAAFYTSTYRYHGPTYKGNGLAQHAARFRF
jgi:hypothetical protein